MSSPIDPLNAAFSAETLKQRSVVGATATFSAQVVKFGLQFVSRVALARLLDPSDFGLVAMVAPVLNFVQVLNNLGFAQAVVQRPEITQRQVSALFWINAAIGLALSIVTIALAPMVAWLYGEPRTMATTAVLGSLIFLTSLSVLPSALLNRQLRFVPLAIADAGCVMAGVLAGVWAALAGWGYWSLIVMQVGTSISSLILLWMFVRWRPSWPQREAGIGGMVRFGANLMGANLATYFSVSADNILVGVFGGSAALGIYDTSYSLVVKPLTQITAPVTRVAVPLLSRLVDSPQRYASNFITMIQVMMLAYVPGMIFATLEAKPLLLFLLGPKWNETGPVFAWISFGGLVAPLFSSATWLLTSQGRGKELMNVSVATAVLSVISFALGIIWGVLGVATLSALCFTFLQFPLIVWVATRSGPLSLRDIIRPLGPFLVAGLVVAVGLQLLQHVLSRDTPLGLTALLVAAYALFLAGLAVLPGGAPMFRRMMRVKQMAKGQG